MKLYKNAATLLLVATAVATDSVGETFRVETSGEDDLSDHEQDYLIYLYTVQQGGADRPTSRVRVQTSPNGEDWVDLVESTKLTSDGVKVETRAGTGTPLLKYVRAITVLGGGTNPDHRCDVRIVSTAPFRLRKMG